MKNGYNPKIICAWFSNHGIPEPILEYRFLYSRKWRFDFAWVSRHSVALEVQGGLFIKGAHVRGAALLREHEKRNAAAIVGWRILYCTPKELMTQKMADTIKAALGI